jgi:hypothetical protein
VESFRGGWPAIHHPEGGMTRGVWPGDGCNEHLASLPVCGKLAGRNSSKYCNDRLADKRRDKICT